MKDVSIENGRKVTINIMKANVFAVVLMLVSAIVLVVPYILIWRGQWSTGTADKLFETLPLHSALFLLPLVVGIVVHELIHGITWACFAPSGWRSISFGVMWKMLTPYCHCNEPMRPRPYIIGALMPLVVLGIIPAVICLISGSLFLLVWSIIFIAAAGGDIWMAWLLAKESPDCTVLDHPSEAGFYVFDKKELS